MMKSSFKYYLLMMMVSVNQLSSQSLDSALAYYPMSVDNQWEYGYNLGPSVGYQYYFTITIGSDTLFSNGKVYKKKVQRILPDSLVSSLFERVDSSTGYVYMVDTNSLNESITVKLNASLYDTGGSYGRLMFVHSDTILGIPTTIKHYSPCEGCLEHTLAYGFGLSRTYEVIGDAWPAKTKLIYAKINSREYGTFVSVDKTDLMRPYNFQLQQNYPNPFNPITTFSFAVPHLSHVTITVTNVLGQQVATITDEEYPAGSYTHAWDATNLSSGIYFYKMLVDGKFSETKKLVLLR
jgi:hypothetical protein